MSLSSPSSSVLFLFFSSTRTSTTEIYTLSLHDALPISAVFAAIGASVAARRAAFTHVIFNIIGVTVFTLILPFFITYTAFLRSEEHTSELQSRGHLVCRLLLEKKKKTNKESNNQNTRDQ